MKLYLSSLKRNGLSLLHAIYHLCAWLFILMVLHDFIIYAIGMEKVYWFNWL